MSTTCEICNESYPEHVFQKHLIECHNMLFSQYIGLISKKINIVKNIDTKGKRGK